MAALQPGDKLGLRGPFGRGWPLQEMSGCDVVLVTGGLGCAPVVSVIHYMMRRRERFGKLVIIQGVKHAEDLIWREQYDRWVKLPDVQVLVAGNEGAEFWPWHVGRVTELFGLAQFNPAGAVAMMCGPEGMMHAAADSLLARGLPESRLFLSMERNMQCAVGRCGLLLGAAESQAIQSGATGQIGIRFLNIDPVPIRTNAAPVTLNDDGLERAQGFHSIAVRALGRTTVLEVVWEDTRNSPEVEIDTATFASPNLYYDIHHTRLIDHGRRHGAADGGPLVPQPQGLGRLVPPGPLHRRPPDGPHRQRLTALHRLDGQASDPVGDGRPTGRLRQRDRAVRSQRAMIGPTLQLR